MSDTAVEISTCPATINYVHFQGNTWNPDTITVSDGGTPVNFTGATASMTFANPVNGTVVQTLTSASGRITLSSVGVITKTMTAAESAALRLGDFLVKLTVTLASGRVWTIENGVFEQRDKNL